MKEDMQQTSDIALKVTNVSKSFKLPTEKSSSLKNSLFNLIRGVHGYTIQEVLKDISFEVHKGDFFGIVGQNGSGKSTLLKIISQIYTPNTGSVQVEGKLVPFIELGVGFNPELTGRENVYLNGAMLGFSKDEIDAMYDDIVDFAELGDFMEQKLKNYSSLRETFLFLMRFLPLAMRLSRRSVRTFSLTRSVRRRQLFLSLIP